MTKRSSPSLHDAQTVYYMGTIHIHIIAGGKEAPRLAVSTDRMDRKAEDAIWKIIAKLSPTEYERLDSLLECAINTLKTPDYVDPWPLSE